MTWLLKVVRQHHPICTVLCCCEMPVMLILNVLHFKRGKFMQQHALLGGKAFAPGMVTLTCLLSARCGTKICS